MKTTMKNFLTMWLLFIIIAGCKKGIVNETNDQQAEKHCETTDPAIIVEITAQLQTD